MNEITTTATRERSRGRLSRRLRQLAIGAAGAACALMLGASAASADSWWSPAYPPRVSVGNFGGDCTIRSGPVYDSNPPAQRWGVIGGGQLVRYPPTPTRCGFRSLQDKCAGQLLPSGHHRRLPPSERLRRLRGDQPHMRQWLLVHACDSERLWLHPAAVPG